MTVTAVLNKVPASVLNAQGSRITTPFRLQVGTSAVVVNENTSYVKAPLVSKVPLLTGSLAWYPFDTYLMKLDIQAVTGTAQFNGGNFSAIDNFEFVVLWPDDFSWTYTVRPTISADFPDATVAGGGTLSDPTTGYTYV
ncbi:hypothetical protein AaE_011767 [Aphanomyces astaci]|uniref:Uncharacterized protein n=1 Tax=Aphanomyces astaci TaxID=112090 RepID=A0A6A4ZGC8_APHAT|nr:hypothetical protein AaE_011767 [Aphanomyces astaci]